MYPLRRLISIRVAHVYVNIVNSRQLCSRRFAHRLGRANRPWHWNLVVSMTPLERTVPERGGLNFAPMVICYMIEAVSTKECANELLSWFRDLLLLKEDQL